MQSSSEGGKLEKRRLCVPRVDQVDADALDDEIFSLWKQQLTNAFKYFKPTYLDSIQPELNAALRFIIWKISVKTFNATIGQQLLLIKYHDTSALHTRNLYLYALGIIGCHWLKERLDTINIILGKRDFNVQWLRKLFDWGEIALKLASFLNFMVFVYEGKYLMFIERILKLEKTPSVVHGFRQLEYDYMARELLWHGFTEFTTFLLPYVNWKFLWNRSSRAIRKSSQPTDSRCCAICQQPFCRPHVIGCEHIFCYYCIMHRFTVDCDCSCPVCDYDATVNNVQSL